MQNELIKPFCRQFLIGGRSIFLRMPWSNYNIATGYNPAMLQRGSVT
jgi:hypothetical protein